MAKIRVAVNGFGRIGRALARILLNDERIDLIAINDLAPIETMAHLFRFDSIHGKWSGSAGFSNDTLLLDNKRIAYSQYSSPEQLPWAGLNIDVVIECTGHFKTRLELEKHLHAGARKVLLSVPPEDDTIKTIVCGINDHLISDNDLLISNASCTTNNAAPMVQLIDELCGIESCYITTVQSIIPTTTGAAKALTRVFPHLREKMGGCGFRVPVPDGSLTDITCTVRNPLSIEAINSAFRKASEERWSMILEYTDDPIVSSDIIGNPASCIFDSQLTSVIGQMVKVVGWYDNEIGYSHRLRDLLLRM
jgi:glyceraldehyde 3-phosphate dehydrogenase